MSKPIDSGTTVALPPIERSAIGIRDALFDEIDLLRAGQVSTAHARVLANLVRQILDAARLEMHARKALQEQAPAKSLILGSQVEK